MRVIAPTVLVLLAAAAPLSAQWGELRLEGPGGAVRSLPLESHLGYAAVPARSLEELGWTVSASGAAARATLPGGTTIELRADDPFVRWSEKAYQLTRAPYMADGELHVPLQLVVDLLPALLVRAYRFDRDRSALVVLQEDLWRGDPVGEPASAESEVRVVIIDAGHGGEDPGTRGRAGVREKDVALSVALTMAEKLKDDPGIEVYLTRDGDSLVPLWERGAQATRWKGDRPGIFISLRLNAAPSSRAIRGFETFFLSEARTDHARRVAANENAPLAMGGPGPAPPESDLSFILRELRNLGYQNWSALLAEMIQSDLRTVHPGPDRGVKQGPFAVMTNALMPAVLVELGFVTNGDEEELLGKSSFQRAAAEAMARSVRRFFERYPPGQGSRAAGRS